MKNYQIFISYRREGGEFLAAHMSEKLTRMGYKVFFDVESMRSGPFNVQILDSIEKCSDVVLILPPNALDRCVDEDDWVRLEIEHAIKCNKNIIPVLMKGFSFPDNLPESLKNLPNYEGVTAASEYFDAVMDKIENLLVCNKKTKKIVFKNEKHQKIYDKISLFTGSPVLFAVLSIIVALSCAVNKGKFARSVYHWFLNLAPDSLSKINMYKFSHIFTTVLVWVIIALFYNLITMRKYFSENGTVFGMALAKTIAIWIILMKIGMNFLTIKAMFEVKVILYISVLAVVVTVLIDYIIKLMGALIKKIR